MDRTVFGLITTACIVAGGVILPSPARVAADPPTDLFFSEYVEGSSNNKALEIHNGTGAAVDLAAGGYQVQMHFNGSATAGLTISLTGTVADGDVFVLAQSSAAAAILAQADQTNGAGWFNGDDAVVLRDATGIVDVIGQIGTDPGTEWGTGLTSTADNTLRRIDDVCAGDTDGSDVFDPSVQWVGFATDTFDGLGTHSPACGEQVVINEVLASTTGTDVEYVELYGTPGASLAGLSIVGVESNDGTSLGTFDFRYDFAADARLGTNGFFLVGTSSLLQSTYAVTPDVDIASNSLENSSSTVALVETASLTGTAVTGAESVVDAVGITDATPSTFFFGAPVIGPDGTFYPAGVRRVADGVDTGTVADWVIADFNLGPSNTPTAASGPDVAPSVVTVAPPDGSVGVPSTADVVVTFSEPVDVAPGAVRVECPDGTVVAESAELTGVTEVTLAAPGGLPPLTDCTVTVDAAGVTDRDGDPDPLADAVTSTFSTADATGATRIHTIQGTGAAALPGTFTVQGVVVGDYQTQGSGQLRGFFVQEEDADADADPATSEGIFVFCATCPTPVGVGDLVRVTGASSEFFSMSQLTASSAASVSVVGAADALPTPAALELPVPNVTPTSSLTEATAAINAYYEAFEGMLVQFPDELSVSEYFELARYGQLILTEGGRPRQFTDTNLPSASGLVAHEVDLARRTVILDDTDNRQNRPVDTPNTPYYHPVPGLSVGNTVRGGDTITALTGVLHWSFAGQTGTDAWRIRPVVEAFEYEFDETNPRPAPPDVGGDVTVASFNVLNYFLSVDTTASNDVGTCGPNATADCRGADSTQELDRQRAKLTQALLGLDADVVGLIEMENTPGVTPQAQIVDDLNAALPVGASPYAYVDTGVLGTDAIRVGLVYRPDVVVPVGDFAVLDSTVDPEFDTERNRPALAQTFEEVASGARFTVVVNHLKSKGSGCGAGDDDTTTGQGNCNLTRTRAAAALARWLATDPTGSDDPDVLIIGDLNSYAKEDPIRTLEGAGYEDLVARFGGGEGYSYVFDGQLGYLDHALANWTLAAQVTGTAEWHINADEVPILDYNDDVRDPGEAAFEEESDTLPLYAPDAFRTSDHDPVVVGLDLFGPRDAFVTGGGWYTSPPGALTAAPAVTGRTTFGFDAKYEPGATTPTGDLSVRFGAGGFQFVATSYDWMFVVDRTVYLSGVGDVGGQGGHPFLLVVRDGAPDEIGLTVWDGPAPDATVVYASGTVPIGRGSIVLHE